MLDRPLSQKELAASLGIGENELARIDVAPNISTALAFSFESIAANGSLTGQARTQAGRAFVCTAIAGLAFLDASVGGAIAGSPLWDGSNGATAANNTHIPYSLVTVNFKWGQFTYATAPLRWPNLVGPASQPFVPPKALIIGPENTVELQGANGTGQTISGQIVMFGHYVAVR